MTWLCRAIAVCALVALVVGCSSGGGTGDGTPVGVYGDWGDNGRIDGHYGTRELRAALAKTRGDVNYGSFADAVQNALDERLLGSKGSGPRRGRDILAPDPGPAAEAAATLELPEPRKPDENGSVPWPFLALSGLGGALILTGAGSSIYRRARRPPAPDRGGASG